MKKELAKTYSPKDFEDRLYHEWEEKKYFHAEIDPKKKPYTKRPTIRRTLKTACTRNGWTTSISMQMRREEDVRARSRSRS